MTKELTLRPQYAQYLNPKLELFGQTRPEPDSKSKSLTRESLLTCFRPPWLRKHSLFYDLYYFPHTDFQASTCLQVFFLHFSQNFGQNLASICLFLFW